MATSLPMKCPRIPQVSHGWFFNSNSGLRSALCTISYMLLVMRKDGWLQHSWRTEFSCQDGLSVIYIFNAVIENMAIRHEMCARCINLWKEKYSRPNDYVFIIFRHLPNWETFWAQFILALCQKDIETSCRKSPGGSFKGINFSFSLLRWLQGTIIAIKTGSITRKKKLNTLQKQQRCHGKTFSKAFPEQGDF